nr:phage portal protein [uncultured Holophaga sp.]
MSLLDLFRAKPAPMPSDAIGALVRDTYETAWRGWVAARQQRLATWSSQLKAEDEEIKRDLQRLRTHSRHLAKNNPVMARYLRLLQTNVIGHTGIQLQCDIRRGKKPLEARNTEVEQAWSWWGGSCSTDGRNMLDLLWSTIAQVAQDGEVLFRKVYGTAWRCGFALEPVDPDRLDHTLNDAQKRIVMGVEQDIWGRPVAYHLWTQHPDSPGERRRERVPASEIIHLYRPQASRQSRGVPWSAPVMLTLNLLGRYWEAEVAAAAHEASRAGFIESDLDQMGDERPTPQDLEIGPITYVGLPPGAHVNVPDVKHPNTALDGFSTAMLRIVASGLSVAHASLANDRGDANYGSQRGGLLDERDNYRVLQVWLIMSFLQPLFDAWLPLARMAGKVSYQSDPKPSWAGRGWDWIDPAKDVKAAIDALNAKIETRTRILAQKGLVFRDVMQELADEEDFAGSLGIDLTPAQQAPPPAPEPKEDDDAAA